MRILITAMVVSLLAWSGQGWAQARPDVRLVVDVSGSMKQNDPNRLSGSALELLVELMPSGVNGGLWTFGSEVANPLPSAEVNEAWRQRALALKPALVDYQQYTDIEQAVRTAAQAGPAMGERHLILLTDGVVDVPAPQGNKRDRDAASRQRLLNELAPELAEEGTVVHTVAFSSGVDLSLVEQVAAITGGLSTVADTPEALLRAFLDVLDRIFPVDQVPLSEGRFTIDDRVDSFSALLFHDPDSPPLVLVGPDGERYTAEDHPANMQWQAQDRFDVITVPSPQAGEWHIEGELGADSRINVDSSLALRTTELPATLYMGFETSIEAWVEDQGTPLMAEEAQDLVLRAEVRDSEGTVLESMQLQRENGHYQGTLPPLDVSGNARLSVLAESPGFVRELHQAVNILPAILAELDEAQTQARLHAEHPRLDTDNTRIEARLQGEPLEVMPVDDKRWRIDLPEIDPSVSIPIELTAEVTLEGERRTLSLPPLRLNADSATGLGSVRLDRQGLSGEGLPGEEEPTAPELSLADRLDNLLRNIANALPQRAQSFWDETRPKFKKYVHEHSDDPLAWTLIIALIVPLLIIVLWRRKAAQRRHTPREEPHV